MDEKYEAFVKVLWNIDVMKKKQDEGPIVQAMTSELDFETHHSIINNVEGKALGALSIILFLFHMINQ
jgi:hypothetical protein